FCTSFMTGTIDFLPCPDSLLRRLDPRWKLAGLGLAIVAVVLLQTLGPAGTALVGAGALAVLGRLPRRWLMLRLGFVALVLAPFVVLLPLIHVGGPTWQLGSIVLRRDGFLVALLLIGKTLALVLLVLVLLTSAPPPDTLKAAQSLRVPGVLVHLTLLTYRYVF